MGPVLVVTRTHEVLRQLLNSGEREEKVFASLEAELVIAVPCRWMVAIRHQSHPWPIFAAARLPPISLQLLLSCLLESASLSGHVFAESLHILAEPLHVLAEPLHVFAEPLRAPGWLHSIQSEI